MSAEPPVDVRSAQVGGVRAAITQPNFAPFLVGNLLSNCGTWFQNIAQTLLVYRLTGSVLAVAIVNGAQFMGVFLVGPAAGVAADRRDRRRLLLATQVFSAAVTAALAVLSATGRVSVVVLVIAALGLGIAQAYSLPSMLSLVPQLVGPEHLIAAVALNIVTFNAARAVGPVLGAVVVATAGVSAAFAVNALSFLALVVALLIVRPAPLDAPVSTDRPRLMSTVRAVIARPELARVFLVGTAASFAIDPITTLTPEFATKIYGQPDTVVGWLVGAFGAGAVIAALWVSGRPLATDRNLAIRSCGLVASMVAFALASSLWLALIFVLFAGCCFISLSTGALTRVQRTTNSSEHGRLMALWAIAFMGSRPIAGLVDGVLATPLGVRPATVLVSMPVLAVAVWMLRRGDTAVPAH